MFKVHEKYNDRETWIDENWIWSIYQHDVTQETMIESKHGDVLYVAESVEEILDKIPDDKSSMTLYGLDGTVFRCEV